MANKPYRNIRGFDQAPDGLDYKDLMKRGRASLASLDTAAATAVTTVYSIYSFNFTPTSVIFANTPSTINEDIGNLTYDSTEKIFTITGELRNGTATDTATPGDFVSGLVAASRVFFDQSLQTLSVYDSSGNEDLSLDVAGDSWYNGSGNFGFGTITPDAKVDIQSQSTNTLRLTHTSETWYTDLSTSSTGLLLLRPSDGGVTIDLDNTGGDVYLLVSNEDDSDLTSHARVHIRSSLNGAGGGDPILEWSTDLFGSNSKYSMGIDNSVSGDPLKISRGSALGTNDLFAITSTGEVLIADVSAHSGFLSILTVRPSLAPGAGVDAYCMYFKPTIAEASSGTHALFAGTYFDTPVITSGAGGVTDACNVYFAGAPSASGATNLNVFVASGNNRFKDHSGFGAITTPDQNVPIHALNGNSSIQMALERSGSSAALMYIGASSDGFGVWSSSPSQLFWISSTGSVGIKGAPSYDLDVTGSARITTDLGIGAAPNASYRLLVSDSATNSRSRFENTAGGSASNDMGFEFYMQDSAGNQDLFAYMLVGSSTATSGSETTSIQIGTFASGSLGSRFFIEGAVCRTAGELEIDGDIDHDGSNIGFFGVTPTARAAAYTVSNLTTDRTYDANATTLDEIADVLGTLIADLRAYGLVQ